ncbi:OLC1v1010687C1 [Oldenlandia corymbosa var. corymbosa]|uniref:OLC1v1010687C1 n=1 Tax=Oldenlandia corymbosa var. corymbosa TaxID=529605 RepID=A0AAV1DV51_OLDCO|nr:OLC1v1010687C1 [Oldenlandia corymbosa var. corymbosa]
MEEPLLSRNNQENNGDITSSCKPNVDVEEEPKRVNRKATPIPMIAATVLMYTLRASPILMLGRLGEPQRSGTSTAVSFSNVTGFGVLTGMSSALETLCAQAFRAKEYQRVGAYAYGAIPCLVIVCIPIVLLWIFTDKLLIFIGQDPATATQAGEYLIWLIPALLPYAVLQCLVRFLEAQSLILPILLSTIAALAIQVPLCWVFISKLNMGNAAGGLSISLSYWINVIFLALYAKYSSTCKETRVSNGALNTIGEIFRRAFPSAALICMEWWAFEIGTLQSCLWPNPNPQTCSLSFCGCGAIAFLLFYFSRSNSNQPAAKPGLVFLPLKLKCRQLKQEVKRTLKRRKEGTSASLRVEKQLHIAF